MALAHHEALRNAFKEVKACWNLKDYLQSLQIMDFSFPAPLKRANKVKLKLTVRDLVIQP